MNNLKTLSDPNDRFEWERSSYKDRSIPFDLRSMAASCLRMDEIVDEIYDSCNMADRVKYKYGRAEYNAMISDKVIIRMILWHAYKAMKVDVDYYVSISMNKNHYRSDSIENPYKISEKICDIVHFLHEHNIIQFSIGYFFPKKSRYTRIRATLVLAADFNTLPHDLGEIELQQLPIKYKSKESGKRIRDYSLDGDAEILEICDIVTEYNEKITYHKISISGSTKPFYRYRDKRGVVNLIDLNKRYITAIVFVDDNEMTYYHRMHKPFWQYLPKKHRQYLLIDDMPTKELDYTAQILNIVASMHGVQLNQHPYAIDVGLGNISESSAKFVVKKATVIMLNCNSIESALQAFRGSISSNDEVWSEIKRCKIDASLEDIAIAEIFEKILNKYPFLREHSFKGQGLTLFKHDAAVARNIMRRFLLADKVVLPIHDGFIVKQDDVDFLYDAMINAWDDRFSTKIEIKDEKFDD